MNILRWRRKSKNKIRLKSILLVIFSLIMTTFAWMAYSKVLDTNLKIHIAAWDMEYYIDDVKQPNPIGIEIPTLYPTMEDQIITIDIKNNGEALVDMAYDVQEITIAGVPYELLLEGEEIPTTEVEGEEISIENYIYVGTPTFVTDAETGELITKGDVINDITRFPFTLKIEQSPQVYPKDDGYLTITVTWLGDNDELDTEWGYTVGKYFIDNPDATSAMSLKLSIDSYQADAEITGNTGDLPNATGTRPYLPSSDFTQVEGTDLETGLVIKDSSGNEYVWIEVPRVLSVYPTAGINITEFTEEEYTLIENDLHTYTSVYRDGTTYEDKHYTDDSTGLTSTKYTELKQKMLKSVYQNGGFYIARYEAGSDTYRTNHTSITGLSAQSQADKYPINWVTPVEAQQIATNVASGERTSSLMFGVQWDLVLRYLETKAVNQGATPATIRSQLKTNSTGWGNYNSSTYDITNENALWSSNNGSKWNAAPYEKTSEGKIYLTTGATTGFSKQNIFDLAGNVWEWTLEYPTGTSNTATIRGGSYESTSTENNANYRNNGYGTFSYYSVGFRVTIY